MKPPNLSYTPTTTISSRSSYEAALKLDKAKLGAQIQQEYFLPFALSFCRSFLIIKAVLFANAKLLSCCCAGMALATAVTPATRMVLRSPRKMYEARDSFPIPVT